MIYSDMALSKQLEKTEARFNAAFIDSTQKMFPESQAEWKEMDGTYVMFAGVESPLTQTFGLGLFDPLCIQTMDEIEQFYHQFSSPVFHEVSPLSDPTHLDILSKRGYQPVEMTNIFYKPLSKEPPKSHFELITEEMQPDEEDLFVSTSAKAWSQGDPALYDFVCNFSQIASKSQCVRSFFTKLDGKPISTGMLFIDNHIALLAGDSTIAEGRNRGGQTALIDARLNHAATHGCTLAMIATSPGSQSQKNAEKNGFRLAYTRTKWKLI